MAGVWQSARRTTPAAYNPPSFFAARTNPKGRAPASKGALAQAPTGGVAARKPPMFSKKKSAKALIVTLVALAVIGSFVGLRATQAKKDEKKPDAKVVLEFTPADVATVELRQLVSAIPFSGSLA